MFALARRLTGEHGLAEEALQDTFVQVWTQSHRFKPQRGSARAWLYSLLRNRIISLHRQAHGHRFEPLPDQDWPDPGPSPEQCSYAESQRLAMIECLRRLQGDRRSPILMAFYHGLSYEQIADRLAVPLGTIKSRIRAGLSRLQECLRL